MVIRRLGTIVGLGLACLLSAAGAASASTSPGLCLSATGSNGWCGDGLAATRAKLAVPRDVAPLPGGGYLIADSVNHVIRRVDARGAITTIAGTGTAGEPVYGRPAGASFLGTPAGVAPLPDGGYLIADSALGEVLRVTRKGRLVAAAGQDKGGTIGDGAPALRARLRSPRDVAMLPDGGYAIVDADDHRVRRVLHDGTIETLAGTGAAGFSGDGGPAAAARLSQPTALAVAADGSVLVADRGNRRIRRIAPDGTISTAAGGGAGATPALEAELTFPTGVAATADGGFLVAEAAAIRRIGPDGAIATVGGTGKAGFNTRRAPAKAVALAYPTAIAALIDGRALVADTLNDRVRLLDPARSTLTTVAGRGVPGPPGTPEPAPGVTLKPSDAPDPDEPILTTPPQLQPEPPPEASPQPSPTPEPSPAPPPPRPDTGGAGGGSGSSPAFARPPRSYCAKPGDPDPRRFSDLHILPFSARVLRTGPRLKVRFAVNRDVTLVAKVTRSGSIVRSRRKKVKAGGLRLLPLKGKLRPGSYRLELQATSHRDRLRRCHALKLRVRR